MAIYSIATKSFLSRYDQSQPNICVAIHPLATTLAVAKKSIGTHVCPLQLYTMAMATRVAIHDAATTTEVVTTN